MFPAVLLDAPLDVTAPGIVNNIVEVTFEIRRRFPTLFLIVERATAWH
jgi:hypothetical protein